METFNPALYSSTARTADEKNAADAPFIILIPVYNDWAALDMLFNALDAALAGSKLTADVLVVDDGSTVSYNEANQGEKAFDAIQSIEILELARNLGHQRAIAVGLAYIEDNKRCQAVIVMDADGEDDPKDVPRLIQAYNDEARSKVVFALRAKRSESLVFKIFYSLYRTIYYLLSGSKVRFGNFSIIPYQLLRRLVVVSEIWNHYAAGILKARIPYKEIPTNRSRRLDGRSSMSFVSLVLHGLGAISVHGDVVGVRALIATVLLIIISAIAISIVVVIRATTDLAIPGWASTLTASFFIILMQAVMVALLFAFMVLNSRSSSGFLPRRDYVYFVLSTRRVFPGNDRS
ncbi:MAG TPA: glycosyltransferase [Blastocatellia bacterium]|nr:glycosyltransferase [Blastocatellia bacterium]